MTTTASYCTYIKANGQACRAWAIKGSRFCFPHDPARAAQRAAAHRAGGKARHGRKLGDVGTAEPVKLESVADVAKLLESEVNAVLSLEKSLSRAQTIARLALAFIKAFEVSEIEQRLSALEQAMQERGP